MRICLTTRILTMVPQAPGLTRRHSLNSLFPRASNYRWACKVNRRCIICNRCSRCPRCRRCSRRRYLKG